MAFLFWNAIKGSLQIVLFALICSAKKYMARKAMHLLALNVEDSYTYPSATNKCRL